jgi:hypothetical protein
MLLMSWWLHPAEPAEDDATIIKTVQLAKKNAVGIFDVGFKVWITDNWWIFILSVAGLGHYIVKFTTTKKDDKWYKLYIVKPLRFIAKIMDLDLIFDYLKKDT